jgi:phenylacetate-coenzyme A ligase PaaK-like adenylate-forming protein
MFGSVPHRLNELRASNDGHMRSENLQVKRLRALASSIAERNVPYYHDLLKDAKLDPASAATGHWRACRS